MNLKLNLRLSDLKRYAIYDSKGQDIGEPIDIALNTNDEYRASSIIIGGGFIEELLEELEKRDNIDEFFSFSQISRIENSTIHLNIKEEELNKTDAQGNLPKGLIRFNTIHRMKVVDTSGNSIGEVHDIVFKEGHTYLVIQDFQFNRNLSITSDYRQRIEFILPISKMDISGETIIAPLSAEDRLQYVRDNFEPKARGIDPIYI